MKEQPYLREALTREIARYLAAVDLFRSEHCEPKWLPESSLCQTVLACTQASTEPATSAH